MNKTKKETRKYTNETIALLYGRSAGHCTICNRPLQYDNYSHSNVNISEKAHIKAFSDLGPRGENKTLSTQEKNSYDNLILLCGTCHSTIDKKVLEGVYTVDWLKKEKNKKEKDILGVMKCLTPKNIYCLKFISPIADSNFNFEDNQLKQTCFNNSFHINDTLIDLSDNLNNENKKISLSLLNQQIKDKFKLLNNNGANTEICVFGLAPQYLLIKFGYELSDKTDAHIFTKHRNGWIYNNSTENKNVFSIIQPKQINNNNEVALIISSSADISNNRILKTLGNNIDIWQLKSNKIGIDNINMQEELSQFSVQCINVLDIIGNIYGKNKEINLFPAMCNSLAIKFGQSVFHKSHNKIIVYDTINDKNGNIIEKQMLKL